MPIAPEAQLEARISAMLPQVFPHIPASNFRHQIRFTVRLGHTEHVEDGARSWVAEGRADIILFYKNQPLAVIELKREDKPLTENDVRQGQSYAAQFTPRPPLVVVSNGNETWLRDSATASTIEEGTDGLELVTRLFANCTKVAAADMAWAIEVLMGPQSGVWTSAIRAHTETVIERYSGSIQDERKPFTPVLFQRKATIALSRILDEGKQAVILVGAPLSGKSNVLREFAEQTRASPDYAMLLVNGATSTSGLFQRLANLFSAELEWSVNADDVRQWLRRMSHSQKIPALVLAVDGIRSGTAIAYDIEELAETGFGPGLRIVLTTNNAEIGVLAGDGRSETALATIAQSLELKPLDDMEFDIVQQVLKERRIRFQPGAELSNEFRTPWLLRAVLAQAETPDDERTETVIPASLGMGFVGRARSRLTPLGNVQRDHSLLARDALDDKFSGAPDLMLAQANAFVVRADALSTKSDTAVTRLTDQGWAAAYRHPSGEDIVSPRAPEFFVSELANEMLKGLEDQIATNPENAKVWLTEQSNRFYLGDLIGAQVLFDFAQRHGGFPVGFLDAMIDDEPTMEKVGPSLLAFQRPDGAMQNIRVNDEGLMWLADEAGVAFGEPINSSPEDGLGSMYGSTTSWMILSHFAGIRADDGTGEDGRIDMRLMLRLGSCRFPLIRGDSDPMGHMIHSLGSHGDVLALEHALAEPLTSAMYRMFVVDWARCDWFLREAVATGSVPLLARIHHSLAALRGNVTPGLNDWAEGAMHTIKTALHASMGLPSVDRRSLPQLSSSHERY